MYIDGVNITQETDIQGNIILSIDDIKIEITPNVMAQAWEIQTCQDFNKLSPELKARNREDVELMVQLEEQKQLIPYFDEIRRLAKVEWEDMFWNSRIIDMLLLEESKLQKEERQGRAEETNTS